MTKLTIANKILANIDIRLENVVVTYKTAVRVLLSIVEFLSYNRNQIPLVYETFIHMVSKLEQCSENADAETEVIDFNIGRQREAAVKTGRYFREMTDTLIKTFKKHEVDKAIIAFGSTAFSAREAYIVQLPMRSKQHSVENHMDSPQQLARKVIMSIITTTEFFDVNNAALKPMNMYIFLKPRPGHNFGDDELFEPRDQFTLPTNCRAMTLNIENDCSNLDLNCCRNISVFTENGTAHVPSANGDNDSHETDPSSENESTFYQCKFYVKGFKDQLVKGQSIWMH